MSPPTRLLAALAMILCTSFAFGQDPPFELRDGDRVVFLGDALIEQEQYHGWVELMLTRTYADAKITFRNLGWNADTPGGASRLGLSLLQAGYEPADEGWKQLQGQLNLTRPSVVILGYGMANALELDDAKIGTFVAEYERLISFLRDLNPRMHMLFLSPLGRVEAATTTPRTGFDQAGSIARVRDAIAQLAERYNAPFVDLTDVAAEVRFRKDAIHLNGPGYRELASVLADRLKLPTRNWQDAETLREVIRKKNEWFFHRSRPANMAYVFGFRKGEQGQNAVEIPQFDALIEKEEQRIAKLRATPRAAIEHDLPQTKSRYAKFQSQPLPEFTTADGLEVTLWAENPMLNKPIQMNFDAAGRLWVASSEAYPMIEVGQTANDRIVVLEDTNQDGRADKSEVFADGLLIPTGVLPTHDGVYVAQSADLLHLQDTDGDGKADQKTRVLSGFGTEDTHHNLHTLRWGPDGRLYMNQSVYTRTDAETPRGVTRLRAGGGFRYEPSTMRMQIFFAGLWNSWGHQFDRFGRSFMSDGAGFSGLAYVFPGAQFRPVPGGQRHLDLISPGNYPKFCSAEIVEGASFPKDWQHSIITCDFRANRVTRFSLVEDGAGYQTVQEADLLRTSTATFRPIDVKQGPDGALYIADWSNPIINHGEVDFRDPRRDRWHGRIWRVAFTDQEPQPWPDFTKQTTPQLLDHVCSDDRYERDRARRVLLSRPEETLAALPDWIGSQSDNFALLQGLWLHQALRVSNERLLFQLLQDTSADVRAAVVRVLADWADPWTDCQTPMTREVAIELYRELIQDAHPRVRLEAILGLTAWADDASARLALQVLDPAPGEQAGALDRFLAFALTELVRDASESLLQSIRQDPVPDHWLEFILNAVEPSQAASLLRDHLDDHVLAPDGSGPWIGLIGKAGGPAELQRLLETLTSGKLETPGARRALMALIEAQRIRKLAPEKGREKIRPLLKQQDQDLRRMVIRLAGLWQQKSMLSDLQEVAVDTAEPVPMRLEAIEALRSLAALDPLGEIVRDPDSTTDVAAAALAALAREDAQQAVQAFLTLDMTEMNEQEPLVALWRAVLSGKDSAALLVSSVSNVRASRAGWEAGLRVAREGGRQAPELVAALNAALGSSLQSLTAAEIKLLAEEAASKGDPYRGEFVYRKQELACVTCHALAGIGGQVGPDLSSIGASAPLDYIAESLFEPNAKVKENFHSVVLITADGRQITGIESAESTAEERVIRDATNALIRVPRDEIEDVVAGPSLMPAGLVERLAKQEQLDLLRFLSLLGKPGDFDTSQRDFARSFQLLAGTHRVEQQGIEPILQDASMPWKPLQARVSGKLDRQVLMQASQQPKNISLVNIYLKTAVEVTSAKTATIQVPGVANVWLDGQQVAVQAGEFAVTLDAGKHELVLQLDARQLPEEIRLTSPDVRFVEL